MKIVHHPTAASLAALLAVSLPAPAALAQPSGVTAYEVISIGVLDGHEGSAPDAMDEFGRIIGYSREYSDRTHYVVWINGRLHVVPPPSGYDKAIVLGISPTTGLLVGMVSMDILFGEIHSAAWVIGRGSTLLDSYLGSDYCGAGDANDAGWIIGGCDTIALLWIRDQPPIDLGHLYYGRPYTGAAAINELGEIVGTSYASMWIERPFLWRDGVMTDIDPESEELGGAAAAINNLSEVVGRESVPWMARYWKDDIEVILPEPYPCGGVTRKAHAINDHGVIVGSAANSGCFYLEPTVWERAHDFRCFQLNDFIPRHPDVDLVTAADINNAGQIACFAEYDNGDERGVLVTPYLFNLSDPTPGTAGEVSEITVTGLVPGQSVRLIWGTEAGAQPIRPGCDGGTLLIRDPRTSFEPVLADGDGIARFNVRIPPQAAGMTVRYQAVCVETCEISHTVTWAIP